MMEHEMKLREEAKRLLSEGKVRMFLGYGGGYEEAKPKPLFVEDPGKAGELVLNAFCGAGLAKYVLDEVMSPEARGESLPPIGIMAKGCDGLGLERLMVDHRVPREDLYIVGVGCRGVVDPVKAERLAGERVIGATVCDDEVIIATNSGEKGYPKKDCLMDKCLVCEDPTPRVYDLLLGDEVSTGPVGPRDFSGVREIEGLSPDERYEFWARQFDRCIRCFACRNACPACNCSMCSLEEREPEWLGRETERAEQFMFHFTRAYHVAGRCVGCGECQKACPMGIPLMLLNEKFMKDIKDLFGEPGPHRPSEVEPLGRFCPDDPEGWREEAETA